MYSKQRSSLIALTLVGAFFLSLGTVFAENSISIENSATKPIPGNNKWWMSRHKSMNQNVAKGNVDLIFIGDSITHGWEGKGKEVWQEYYADRNAVNLGIGGDRTGHVLWRLANGNIKNISPKLAVVMIGTNNHVPRNTPEETAEGVTQIVQKLRTDLPKTKVLLLGIFPRGVTPADAARQGNEKVNAMIQKLADGENVIYFDFGKKFLTDNGILTKEIMADRLHPGKKGYRIWAEAIEPFIVKYVDEKKAAPQKDASDKNAAGEKGFTSLFDGKTLDGWIVKGGTSTYAVKDGCIVGTVDTKTKINTFLCTDKDYGDFVLKLEVKLGDPCCNSGIQFRSHTKKNGRVFGYQSEIDPSKRAWTAGIYDEGRRGWIYKLDGDKHVKARKAFKLHDWNTIKIQAEGDSIKTWVNGVLCTDLTDDADASGFIGLQVHAGGPGTVIWRNVRIQF